MLFVTCSITLHVSCTCNCWTSCRIMTCAQWLASRHVTPEEAPPLSGERDGGRSRERKGDGEGEVGARSSEEGRKGASGGEIRQRVIKGSEVRKTLAGTNTMAQYALSAAGAILTETLAGEAVGEERSRAVMNAGDKLRSPNREEPPFKKREKNDT